MSEETPDAKLRPATSRMSYDALYAGALIVIAIGLLSGALVDGGATMLMEQPAVGVFFFAYALFTIAVGYPHPSYGHVSFDRVAQVASLLVLGPAAAALINGAASLIYPWHRLLKGASFRAVAVASLHNAGLMSLMILAGGALYQALGGPVPLTHLDWRVLWQLLVLAVCLQVINDVGMLVYVSLRGVRPGGHWHFAPTAIELASVTVAVLVAIVFTRMEVELFALLVWVLSLGMLAHKQFANMRQRLEVLVTDRTRELHAKTLELERQATHDKLTGLFNRRYADDYLDRALQEAQRYGQRFTVALADVDHFKAINDGYSHATGDIVLRRVARLLAERCRSSDMIARYGGEEFLLCFPETDVKTAGQVCEALRAGIESANWSAVVPGLSVTLSFGLAECQPDFRRKSMLSVADSRLYEAKRGGRNKVVA